jgi:hypothetical protein
MKRTSRVAPVKTASSLLLLVLLIAIAAVRTYWKDRT